MLRQTAGSLQRRIYHTAAVCTRRLQHSRIPQAPCPSLRKLLDSALAWSGGCAGGGLQAF
jgi:hypothetical protein